MAFADEVLLRPADRQAGVAPGFRNAFRYYFPDSDLAAWDRETAGELVRLADVCARPSPREVGAGPAWPAFGALIRRDIALPSAVDPVLTGRLALWRDQARPADQDPAERAAVVAGLENLRCGRLDLTVLDGAAPHPTLPGQVALPSGGDPAGLALMSLHNALADAYGGPALRAGRGPAIFDWARIRLRWTYQWLILNAYLPAICHRETLRAVIGNRAALYSWFLRESGGGACGNLPLPLEFIVPDWTGLLDQSAVAPAKWHRHVRANLLSGALFNLPSAQSLIDELLIVTGTRMTELTADQIGDMGDGRRAVPERLTRETPLWFYGLQEMRHLGRGRTLGPLGSLIVAGTLVGLVLDDPQSCWHAVEMTGSRWRPADLGIGAPETLAALLAAKPGWLS